VGNVNEAVGGFAPFGGVADFDFADALDDGLPEIAESDEGLVAHHALVDHFPDDGEFNESAGAAGARDVSRAAANELKEALLPSGDAGFLIHPAIRARAEKFSGDGERPPARFFRAARNRFHHTPIAAAANNEPLRSERSAKILRQGVMRVAFARARAAEDGDDLGVAFNMFRSGAHLRFFFTGAPRSSTMA